MGINSFPSKELFSIQQRLNSKSLTISELSSIETQVLNTDDATSRVGLSILGQIQDKRETLLKKEVTHLGEGSISSQVRRVQLVSSFLAPSQLEEEIGHLKEHAKVSSPSVQAQIEAVEFQSAYPVAMELQHDAAQSTFANRMIVTAKEMRAQNSMAPFQKHLNEVQQKDVLRFSSNPQSPEDVSLAIEKYVDDLQRQSDAALDFHFDRVEQGELKLESLSSETQDRVDELVWVHSEGATKEDHVMTDAILHSLEERMGMHGG